jgi:Flp pilus assembly protein TadD
MTAHEHNAEGVSLARQGRTAEALEAFKTAIALQPNFAEAHYNLGKALKDSGKLPDSADSFRQAVQLAPNSGAAWQNLGNVLQELKQPDQAIDAYRHVLSLEPDNPGAHGMLARLLHQTGQIEAALPHFRALALLVPNNPEPPHALGVALHDLGRLDEAAAAYRAALALEPNHSHASYALGLIHLAQGDFETGWKLYESRRRVSGPRAVRDFPQPTWDGSPLKGQTILLHAEQGLGDSLQFIRYAPLVTARGGRVLLQCPAPLVRLLQNQLTIQQIVPDGAPLPPFNLHCPLLSLPAVFQTTLQSIPATVPYLTPDPADIAHWRSRLDPLTGSRKKIGLVWSGSPGHRNDTNRSIPPDALSNLANLPNIALISLQRNGPPSETLKQSLIDFTPALTDLAQTAALIANVDLVISVDTAVAHLAGALAKPTWLLLPYAPDWRWLLDRDDSPWYATLRLFRQPAPGNWTEPLSRIARAIVAE